MKADRVFDQKRRVGMCPRCAQDIEAKVKVAVVVGVPLVAADGDVSTSVTSKVVECVVSHRCKMTPDA